MVQRSLIPSSLFNLPTRFPFLPGFEAAEAGWNALAASTPTGLDVYQAGKSVIVEAALPGLKRTDVEVTLDKNILFIRGSKKNEQESKNKQYYRKSSSSFMYSIELPTQADTSKQPKVALKDGILTVTFNKRNQQQPKQIQIK